MLERICRIIVFINQHTYQSFNSLSSLPSKKHRQLRNCQGPVLDRHRPFHASIRKIGQHLKPEIGAFMLGDIQTKNLFPAFEVDAEDCIHCLTSDLAIFPNLVVDGIEPDNRINRCQRPGLPLFDRMDYFISNGAQGAGRNLKPVEVTKMT